jgi:hypothetical protein
MISKTNSTDNKTTELPKNLCKTDSTSKKAQKQWNVSVGDIKYHSSFQNTKAEVEDEGNYFESFLKDIFDNPDEKIKEQLLSVSSDELNFNVELNKDGLIIQNEEGKVLFQRKFSELEKCSERVQINFLKMERSFKEIRKNVNDYVIKNPETKSSKIFSKMDEKVNRCFEAARKRLEIENEASKRSTLAKHEAKIVLTLDVVAGIATALGSFTGVLAKSLSEIGNLGKGALMAILGAAGLEGDGIGIVSSKENIKTVKKFFKKIGSRKALEIFLKVLLIITGIVVLVAAIMVLFHLPGCGIALGILFGGIGLYNIASLFGIGYEGYKLYNCLSFRNEISKILKDETLSEYEKYKKYMNFLMKHISVDEEEALKKVAKSKAPKLLKKCRNKNDLKEAQINEMIMKEIYKKHLRKTQREIGRKVKNFKALTNGNLINPEKLFEIFKCSSTLNNEGRIYSEKEIKKAIEKAKDISKEVDKAAFLASLKASSFLALNILCLFGNLMDLFGGCGVFSIFFWNAISVAYLGVDLVDIKGDKIKDGLYTAHQHVTSFREKITGKKEKKVGIVFFKVVLNRENGEYETKEESEIVIE